MKITFKLIYTCLLGISLLISSARLWADNNAAVSANDPYETFNRHAFKMNDTLDKAILEPAAKAYNVILPQPVRTGVSNFFGNLGQPSTIINDLLQAQFLQATADTWRFAINSTLGVFGLFDVAKHMDLPPHSNDFGLTLAKWGYTSSAYFVIPILGPSTVRDTFGMVPDYQVFSVYPYIEPDSTRYSLVGLNAVNKRAQLLQFQGFADEASVDSYVFQRNAYLQHRKYVIDKNNGHTDDSDPYVP